MKSKNKFFGMCIATFFILFNLGNIFAIQLEEVDLGNRFYASPSKLSLINENDFKFDLVNRTGVDLKLSYKSEFCKIELPETITQQRLRIKGHCDKSDTIEIFGNERHTTKINIDITYSEIIEPPIVPPDEPEEPINNIKISSGRNLTQEGINKYGKDNFYHILNRISIYSKEFKLNNFYWKNSKIYDITYYCGDTIEGHKKYCLLETINLN